MKKTISFFVAAILAVNVLVAQTMADGIKYIGYAFKNNTARDILKKSYDANPKDPQTIYWYGQSLIAGSNVKPEDIQAAKAVYQKALTDGVNDPLIWVGMGHVELLEGGDINAAKQKFEQAITATTATRGRNRGKPNPQILAAIGRANADGGSKMGDPAYGIEKLKRAAELDPKNSDIFVNMGICYLKLGSENGGEAVKSFEEALTRDPKNAVADFRIGNVYLSQNNVESFTKYFDDAIAADPAFPDVYLTLFNYYKYKDVNKAKDYLDKFIANADKDPKNDYFVADYLFQAGNYKESLAKAKEIETSLGGTSTLPRLNLLYAYDYDRLGDSVQAKTYLEKFFSTVPVNLIQPSDYDLAVKVFSRFPGSEATAVGYLRKAIDSDTSKVNKVNYMGQAAAIMGKAKMYDEQLKWMIKQADLKGAWDELEYYQITNAALMAKDYPKTMGLAAKYIAAFPDKPQGYYFNVRAAKEIDTSGTLGTAIEPINQQNAYFMKDLEKNRKAIFNNYYYLLVYYGEKVQDPTKAKAIEICDKMLELYPNPGEENDFAKKTKEALEKAAAAAAKLQSGKTSDNQPKK